MINEKKYTFHISLRFTAENSTQPRIQNKQIQKKLNEIVKIVKKNL